MTGPDPWRLALGRFIALTDAVGRLGAVLAALCLAGILVLMLGEIFTRSVLGGSLQVTWEFAAYLLGMMIFLGAGWTLRTGGHVRVGLLLERLPAPARPWLDGLCTVAALLLGLIVAVALTELAAQSFARGVRSWFPSQTPLALPQAVLAAGAWALWLQLLARLAALAAGRPAELAPPSDLPGAD